MLLFISDEEVLFRGTGGGEGNFALIPLKVGVNPCIGTLSGAGL